MEVRRLRDDELQHHGVKGQRWGVRRYQNANGTLTAAGRVRYNKLQSSEISKVKRRLADDTKSYNKRNDKIETKLQKAKENNNAKKVSDLTEKKNINKQKYAEAKKIAEKEISVLKNYKLSDFNKEKHNINKMKTEAAIASVSSMALATVMASTVGVGFGYIFTVDSTKQKTNMRTNYNKKDGVLSIEAKRIKDKMDNTSNVNAIAKLKEKYNKQLEKDKYKYG